MKYLIVTLRTPEFDPAFIPAHHAFLDELRTGGILEQAGPFTDMTGGAYVICASCLDEARGIAEQDPLSRAKCSTILVREWKAS